MTLTEIRRETAEIAYHLAEVQALARDIRSGHPQGETLYRALLLGGLPAEHADPIGTVEDVMMHLHPQRYTQEDSYEYLR